MEILLEGIRELKQDFQRVEEFELLNDSFENVKFLTKHLKKDELFDESLNLFKDIQEVSSPAWETETILLERLEVAETEIEHRLREVYFTRGSKIETERSA
jgi:lipoate synthase